MRGLTLPQRLVPNQTIGFFSYTPTPDFPKRRFNDSMQWRRTTRAKPAGFFTNFPEPIGAFGLCPGSTISAVFAHGSFMGIKPFSFGKACSSDSEDFPINSFSKTSPSVKN